MVKSPGTSPDRKKAKIEVYPMIVKDPKAREIKTAHLLSYTTALSGFEIPTENQLAVIEDDLFRHHPNEDVEKYFRASAQWGVPAIAWNIVRPAFLWKLEFCITEFMHVEKKKRDEAAANAAKGNNENEKATDTPVKEKMSILGHKINLIKTTPVIFHTHESMEFVLDKAKAFDGFPFTWQRLCELLTEPMKHYNAIDKFLRAVEKVINVVTTIDEHGGRSAGDWDVPHSHQQNVENLFFGAVDEVEMMELEKLKHDLQANEEPLDMSQKSMPAPRAPPTGRSPSSSPKGMSPASSPKTVSPVSSPKSSVAGSTTPTQSPKKEEPVKEQEKEDVKETENDEEMKEDNEKHEEDDEKQEQEKKEEPMEDTKDDAKEEVKEEEKTKEESEKPKDEEMPEEKVEEKKEEEMKTAAAE